METHGAGPPWRPGHQHLCSCIPVASSPRKLKLLGSGGMCMTWCRPCPLPHKVLSDFASTLAGERFAQYDPELLLPMVPYLTNASSTKNFGFPLKPLPLLSDLLRTPPYLIPQLLFSLPLPLFYLTFKNSFSKLQFRPYYLFYLKSFSAPREKIQIP